MEKEQNLFLKISESLDETFSKTLFSNWDKYLTRLPELREEDTWMFFSDYCLCDKSKYNDCFSFTMCPTRHFKIIMNNIEKNIPCDIKKATYISKETTNFLKNPYFFNISFIYDNIKEFSKTLKNNNNEILHKLLEADIENLSKKSDATEFEKMLLSKTKKIYENSKAKNFNTLTYTKILLIAFLAAYVAYFLTKNLKLKKLIWLSDRGLVFDYNDGLCLDYYNQFYHNLFSNISILLSKPDPFGIAKDTNISAKMWYDNLIKFPDYSAGSIASWDINTNNVDKDKHVNVIENVIADNYNFNIIKISYANNCHQVGFLNVKSIPRTQ